LMAVLWKVCGQVDEHRHCKKRGQFVSRLEGYQVNDDESHRIAPPKLPLLIRPMRFVVPTVPSLPDRMNAGIAVIGPALNDDMLKCPFPCEDPPDDTEL
jgi:hypothetical protein